MAVYGNTDYEYAADDPRRAGSGASRYYAAKHMPVPGRGDRYIRGTPAFRWDPYLKRAVDIPGAGDGSHKLFGDPREKHWSEVAGDQARSLAEQRQGTISRETGAQGRSGLNLLRSVLAKQGMGGGADEGAALAMLMRGTADSTMQEQGTAGLEDYDRANKLHKEERDRNLRDLMSSRKHAFDEESLARQLKANNKPDYSFLSGLGSTLMGL